MYEKETASIIKFVIEATGGITPYYQNMPENFVVPSAYFLCPEIICAGDTFSTYGGEYAIYIIFFHSSTELAFGLAAPVLHKINQVRRLIPMIGENGKASGKYVRVQNLKLKKIDECACQLQIDWISRRPYDNDNAQLIQNFYLNGGKV